jgi:hypothetical protein
MNETRNETNRRPSSVACDERHVPNDLTFRFPGGFAGPDESIIVRLSGVIHVCTITWRIQVSFASSIG